MTKTLEDVAAETDRVVREARSNLVAAIRQAHQQGLSQREIARRIGRSQPEVSRLIRFHGTGPLARKLRAKRDDVVSLVEAAGGSDVRVFGSVATGAERPGSDIDLVFTMGETLTLFELSELELAIADSLGTDVDLVPDSAIRPAIRDRVLEEAIAL